MASLEETSVFSRPPSPPPAMLTFAENFPIAVKAVPKALDTFPTAPTTFPRIRTAGPMAAAKAAHFTMDCRWLSSRDRNFSSRPFTLSMICWIVGFRSSPIRWANMSAVFFRFFSLLAVVPYMTLDFCARAVFSSQASAAISCAFANSSVALTARSIVSRRRISLMPISSRTATEEMPSSFISARLSINR